MFPKLSLCSTAETRHLKNKIVVAKINKMAIKKHELTAIVC